MKEKEHKATPECLSKISVTQVLEEVNKHLEDQKKVFVLMLTYNGLGMTIRAVDSVRSFHNYDIFIVDNKSTDGTIEWLQKNNIEYISKQSSVAGALNIGLKKAYDKGYDYVLVCNNDIVLEDNYIDGVVEIAERRQCLAVSGRIINKNEKIVELPSGIKLAESAKKITIAGLFSAILLSRKCLEVVGAFDERYYPRYQEDDDYLLRIRLAGGELIYAYSTAFLHILGNVVKTIKKEKINMIGDWDRNVQQYKSKWGFDPYKERDVHVDLENIKRHCPGWKKNILIPLGKGSKVKIDKRHDTVEEVIKAIIVKKTRANVLIIRRMGGAGDIIFSSVIARSLKKYHEKRINIDYAIPVQFFPVLEKNPYIRRVIDCKNINQENYDFVLDITDYEHQMEMSQVEKSGKIESARTELYLDLIKYKDSLKPDYFVSKKEVRWAEDEWGGSGRKRIGMSFEGSNLMKSWHGMEDLCKELVESGYHIIQLDEKIEGKYRYNFRQMGAIIAVADLVISPDTGVSNQAGALNIPVITVFSNRNGKIFEIMFKYYQTSCYIQVIRFISSLTKSKDRILIIIPIF